MVLYTLIWSSIRVTLLTLKISNWWKTQNLAELLEEKWSPLGIFIKTVFHGISLCRRQWSSWDRTSVGDHSFQSTRRYFENGQEMLPLVLWFKCLLIPSKWNWRCWSLSSVWLFVAPWTCTLPVYMFMDMNCAWNSPDKNTGVGCHSLPQGSSLPRDQTQVSSMTDSLPCEPNVGINYIILICYL